MANLFIFDPEIATADEVRNFWDFLVRTEKVVQVEVIPVPPPQNGYQIKGRVFERLPFDVWGFEKDYAILQAVREYRRILMTVGAVISDEINDFRKAQGK